MKKRTSLIIVFLLSGLFLLGSCYTKKKGIVPCPHGYNDVQTTQTDQIPTEPA